MEATWRNIFTLIFIAIVKMERYITVAIIVLLGISLVNGHRGQHQPSITTTGEASVFVKPNQVVVTFAVESFDGVLSEAKSENDAKSAQFVAAIKALGVDDKDIQTQTMNVDIVYDNNNGMYYGTAGQKIAGNLFSLTLVNL